MVVAFHWVVAMVRTRVFIIERVCQPHAGSFHRSFRGSTFLSRKLSRKLPWDFCFEAAVEESYYQVCIIANLLFTSTKAWVEDFVEATLLSRNLP